ncbi:HCL306Wp [Eremothecium sinecaudum]|uniref:HCL306Wp n=1 Tax=Eremothecium sinecaudum TaxID=45286 RepID=A0A120K1X4_9SACH|nr:HCL306Wp [Eremothecium sinecaudum]AMD19845.1 HCL306Wp [Eremothecium sinecaudum]
MELLFCEDINADLLHSQSLVDSTGPIIFFIPGNPGLINFYWEFLRNVSESSPKSEVVGIGHSGMSCMKGSDLDNDKVYTLDEQVEAKVKVINEYTSANPARVVTLMGHSIGCYMIQKIVMHEKFDASVEHIKLLTPTIIDIHRSRKGTQLTRISEWCPKLYDYITLMDSIIFNWLLPVGITEWLASKLIGKSDECVLKSLSQLLLNPSCVKQALGLAQHEMSQVRNQWDFQEAFIKTTQANGSKLQIIFTKGDHWVHPDTMKDIIELYEAKYTNSLSKLLHISITDEFTHSFVVGDTMKVVNLLLSYQ